MTRHRTHRADANQGEIVKLLRSCGATVAVTSQTGVDGFPDLVVGYHGRTMLAEVKRPGEGLSAEQVIFHREWRGAAIAVLWDRETAVAWLNRVARG